jgi:hypothetical protein
MRTIVIGLLSLAFASILAAEGALYLVVTPDMFYDEILPLADWKTKKGMPAYVATLSEIGSDTSDIREFIQTAYATWDPCPEYLLIVGEAGYGEFIRMPRVNGVRSDNYYANVEGDFRNELIPGRISVSTEEELEVAVHKTLEYQRNPVLTDTAWYLRGSRIGRDGDISDSVYWRGLNYAAQKMYQAGYTLVDSFSGLLGDDFQDVIEAVDEGRSILTYRGEASCHWWSPFDVNPDATSNGWMLPFIVSPTCQMIDTNGGSDCGEKWLKSGSLSSPRGGIGFCGTTYTSHGAELAKRRTATLIGVMDGIFDPDILPTIGYAVERGREAVYDSFGYQWDYDSFICIGDPELTPWTAVPIPLDVDCPPVVQVGVQDLTVKVNADGGPVSRALVCLCGAGGTYESGYTDSLGDVTFSLDLSDSDTLDLTVTAQNAVPHEGTVLAVPEGPCVVYESHSLYDESSGNGDGRLNSGETVSLGIGIKNWGTEPAVDVEGRLVCTDPWVTTIDSLSTFGTLDVGETATSQTLYRFAVAPDCPDGHLIGLDLLCLDVSGSEWTSSFELQVAAPILRFVAYVADDETYGDGDGVLERFETALLDLTIRNEGLANGEGVHGTISTDDPYLVIQSPEADFSLIPPGGTGSSLSPFLVHVNSHCPMPHFPEIVLDLFGDLGYSTRDTFTLMLGASGYAWDVEDTLGWNHVSCTPGYGDQWHWSLEHVHSGERSWKCGAPGVCYDDSLDAGLLTPEFELESGSELTFHHWIDAANYGENECFDGSIVEIQVEGGDFQVLVPDEGYPYSVLYGVGNPFPGQQAFSGCDSTWPLAHFDLSGFQGTSRLRFRFGSGHWYHGEGWYIDDIAVTHRSQPDIDLDPWSFLASLGTQESTTCDLKIVNAGGERLAFSIQAEYDSVSASGTRIHGHRDRTDWLQADPDSGSVEPDSSRTVKVVLKSDGLGEGAHWGRLRIVSDDPDEPWLLVPVELDVYPGHCGDANGSETITPTDGYFVLNYLGAGEIPVTCWAANVSGDDILTPSDGFVILNYIGSGPDLDCQPCEFFGNVGISLPKRVLR